MNTILILYHDKCFLSACVTKIKQKYPFARIHIYPIEDFHFISHEHNQNDLIVLVENELPDSKIYLKTIKLAFQFYKKIVFFDINGRFKTLGGFLLFTFLIKKIVVFLPELILLLSGGLIYLYLIMILPFLMLFDFVFKHKQGLPEYCKYHVTYIARAHEWSGLRRRPQQLIRIAAKETKCIFFEKRLNLIEALKNPFSIFIDHSLRKRWFNFIMGGRWYENIFCVPTFYINTTGKNFGLYKLSQWLSVKINRIFYYRVGIKAEKHLLFHADVMLPNIFIQNIPKLASIYNCLDDYASYPMHNTERDTISISYRDKKYCMNSDMVLTVSDDLTNKRVKYNKHCYTVKNGVDVKFILEKMENANQRKSIFKNSHPTIGYVGGIRNHPNDKVDLDLLYYIIQNKPEWNWCFIGPGYGMEQSKIFQMKNTRFLGFIPYEDLPGLYQGIDIWMLPYNINTLTDNMSPLKLYDYLATGKPIVSTKVKQAILFREVIYIAKDSHEFLSGIELALQEKSSKQKSKERISLAMENSWHNRYDEIKNLINHLEES
ncbi:MAG: hypothetical protein DRI95_11425 [Bacteroidetes bacterium]|nr:MAG: hypothetical protein DRI95_11425 [Bacteroidota bacterium]